MSNLSNKMENAASASAQPWLVAVQEEVEGLRFGTVQVVVHEGEVVQIERVSRRRIGPAQSSTRHPVIGSAKNTTKGS